MITLKTIHKIKIARIACSTIRCFRKILGLPDHVTVHRGGFWWHLDLIEGIDFSIYLLGGFEPLTLNLYRKFVKSGDIVLDIGANIGSHTLPLVHLVGETGKVFAFELTRYAFDKLNKNISLNSNVMGRISVSQVMLVANECENLENEIYSSCPLFGNPQDLHGEHRGRLMDTSGVGVAQTPT